MCGSGNSPSLLMATRSSFFSSGFLDALRFVGVVGAAITDASVDSVCLCVCVMSFFFLTCSAFRMYFLNSESTASLLIAAILVVQVD